MRLICIQRVGNPGSPWENVFRIPSEGSEIKTRGLSVWIFLLKKMKKDLFCLYLVQGSKSTQHQVGRLRDTGELVGLGDGRGNSVDIFDIEDVAQAICGLEVLPEKDGLEAELLHQFGVTLDELFDLVEAILQTKIMTRLYRGLGI